MNDAVETVTIAKSEYDELLLALQKLQDEISELKDELKMVYKSSSMLGGC